MKVHLTYFKPNGKYYADGEYETHFAHLYDIWEEVRNRQRAKHLPGLIEGSHKWIISVDVPEHECNHPHLIIPDELLPFCRRFYEGSNLYVLQDLEDRLAKLEGKLNWLDRVKANYEQEKSQRTELD